MSWIKKSGCEVQTSSEKGKSAGWKAERILYTIGSLFSNLWAFLMLAAFPLYAPDQYFDLGQHKFQFFLWVSVGCLIPAAAVFLVRQVILRLDKGCRIHRQGRLSALDFAVLCFLAALVVSFFFSSHKKEVWIGADGWYMGLRTWLFLIAAYFCLSRSRIAKKILLAGYFFGFGAACLAGILHRFRIDPLGMYEGIGEKYYLEFLSTMGQATWFSSYVCTVLAISTAYFFAARKTYIRVIVGVFCAVGFATAVTQNSDSAFLALGALFLCLFWVACQRMEWMERFFETLLLMLGSFKVMGILQIYFADRAIQLDGISVFLSQSTVTWMLLLAVSVLYMLFLWYRMRHEQKEAIRAGRWLPQAAAGTVTLAASGYALAVWLNTTGRLAQQSSHQYLLFNYAWGNFRGFIWKFALKVYREMPLMGKLFGTGPDGFKAYCYANTSYADELNGFYGAGQVLTNAHNELLNVLICLGAVGLAAFLALFIIAIRRFVCSFVKCDGSICRRAEPLVLAGGLAAAAYLAHNLFCYQQVCCTPFLFLVLGLAENAAAGTKNGIHK